MNVRNERGLSLLEMMITVAILGMVIGIIGKFFSDAQSGLIDTENRTDLAAITQRVSLNLRTSVLQDNRLLINLGTSSTQFQDYYSCLSAGVAASPSQAPIAVNWSAAPLMSNLNEVTGSAVATGTTVTVQFGNSLVFIAVLPTVQLQDITDNAAVVAVPTYTAAQMPMTNVTLTRYQISALYLSLDTTKKVIGEPGALRLVEWRSKPYVDYNELNNMIPPNGPGGIHLTKTVQALMAMGYDYAFDTTAADANGPGWPLATGAFYILSGTAAEPVDLTPTTMTMFPEQSWAYEDEFVNTQDPNPNPLSPKHRVVVTTHHGGISGYPSTYSIAYNVYNPGNGIHSPDMVNQILGGIAGYIQVPLLATPSSATPFPGGFEVGVVGEAQQREVWIRTVYMASSGARPENNREMKFTGAEEITDVAVDNPD